VLSELDFQWLSFRVIHWLYSSFYRKNLGSFAISDIPTELQYNFTEKPKLQASFRLNSNGMFVLEKVEAELSVETQVKIEEDPLLSSNQKGDSNSSLVNDTSSSSFSDEKKESAAKHHRNAAADDADDDHDHERPIIDNDGFDEGKAETMGSEDPKKKKEEEENEEKNESEEKERKPDKAIPVSKGSSRAIRRVHRLPLKVTMIEESGMTEEELRKSRDRLEEVRRRADEKRERERERNALETYLYEMQERIETPEILAITNEAQRNAFRKRLEEAGSWLDTSGTSEQATGDMFRMRLRDLRESPGVDGDHVPGSAGNEIELRVTEQRSRGPAADALGKAILAARQMLVEIAATRNVTDTEVDAALEECDATEQWLAEQIHAQEQRAPFEMPSLRSETILFRGKELESRIRPLARRPLKKEVVPMPDMEPDQSIPNNTTQHFSAENTVPNNGNDTDSSVNTTATDASSRPRIHTDNNNNNNNSNNDNNHDDVDHDDHDDHDAGNGGGVPLEREEFNSSAEPTNNAPQDKIHDEL